MDKDTYYMHYSEKNVRKLVDVGYYHNKAAKATKIWTIAYNTRRRVFWYLSYTTPSYYAYRNNTSVTEDIVRHSL